MAILEVWGIWISGDLPIWLVGHMEIWRSGNLEICGFGDMGIWGSGDPGIWRFRNLEIRRYEKSGPAGLGNSICEKYQTEQILGQFGKSWGGVLAEGSKININEFRIKLRAGIEIAAGAVSWYWIAELAERHWQDLEIWRYADLEIRGSWDMEIRGFGDFEIWK